jgi:hypothetical protein
MSDPDDPQSWVAKARNDLQCDLLTPYAVVMRYPGLQPDVDEHDAREAVDAANRIHAAVLPLLSQPSAGTP